MTLNETRRTWLEREMRKVPCVCKEPWNADCHQDTLHIEHHFFIPDYPALAALLDAPLGEMEIALERVHRQMLNHGIPPSGELLDCYVCNALTRLPWRREETR